MRRFLLFMAVFAIGCGRARAATDTFQGFCTVGNVRVAIQGMQSTNTVQGSFPRCLVTVYLTGSTNLATIYADGNDSLLANPFTANLDGSWRFWANNTNGYDILLQGGTPPFNVPYTLVNVKAGAVVGQALPIPLSSVLSPTAPAEIDLENFHLRFFGSAPAAIAGNGANGSAWIDLNAGDAQSTTGTTGQTGGLGSIVTIAGGKGGDAPAGSSNGNGGSTYIEGGVPGAGAGTPGNYGDVLIQNNGGTTYIGGTQTSSAVVIQTGGAFSAVSGMIANSPICTEATGCETGPGPTYPPAGVGVSTGTAWSPNSIPAANIPLLNAPSNAFSGPLFTSQLGITNPNTGSGASLIAVQPNITPGNVTSLFVGQSNLPFNAASFGFDFEGADSTGNRGIIGFAGESRKVAFDSAANWTFDGIVTTPQLTINSSITGDNSPVFAIQPNITAGSVISLVVGQSNSLADAVYYGFNFAGAGSGSNHGIIGFVGGNRQVTFDQDANWAFDGIVTAAVKNFKIRYPGSQAKDNRWLIHSSLEGPEIAVFYRGESTTHAGNAEVKLPAYFEALTRKDNRTVLLTAITDDDTAPIGMLAASHVTDGKFRVRSTGNLEQPFYWEVKAVRSDQPPLEVEGQSTPPPPVLRHER